MSAILKTLMSLWLPLAAATPQELVEQWSRPVEPFRILGNLYYVGAHEVTAFLVATPQGHILIDGGLPETGPMVAASIEQLGFELSDVRWLLNSHAHFDHAGGLAYLKEKSGARLAAMAGDAATLTRGDGQFGGFPAVAVDRVLHDGDRIELGGAVLVARHTPGHTPGCTTWTTTVREGNEDYDVVFVGSPSALAEHRLVGNEGYPSIASDFRMSFERLRSLPADVFLASHGSFFHLADKRERMRNGEGGHVFIDPEGYQRFIDRKEQQFLELWRNQSGTEPTP